MREIGVVSKETLWNKNNLSCVIGKSLFHKMSCFENLISSIFLYSVQVNRVATYKELDSYFQKQSALFNVNLLVSVFKSGKVKKWLFEERKFECRETETLHHLNWTQRILAMLFPQRKHFRVRVTGKSSDILISACWTSYFQFQAVF